jgi:hypothetical protein
MHDRSHTHARSGRKSHNTSNSSTCTPTTNPNPNGGSTNANASTRTRTSTSTESLQSCLQVLGVGLELLDALRVAGAWDPRRELAGAMCVQLVPALHQMLKQVLYKPQLIHPCLRFTHWCLLAIARNQGDPTALVADLGGGTSTSTSTSTNTSLGGTSRTSCRRIGELLLPLIHRSSASGGGGSSGSSGSSEGSSGSVVAASRLDVLLLSSLVVVQLVPQADHAMKALETIRRAAASTVGQGLLLQYQALEVLLSSVFGAGGVASVVVRKAVDVLLATTVESEHTAALLAELCTHEWFGVLAGLMGSILVTASGAAMDEHITPDVSMVEKVAVVLQKLSKIKAAAPLFAKVGLLNTIRTLLHHHKAHIFLCMNLSSALSNLSEP